MKGTCAPDFAMLVRMHLRCVREGHFSLARICYRKMLAQRSPRAIRFMGRGYHISYYGLVVYDYSYERG